MESIREYSNLIKHIPVNNQSAIIKKDTWERFSNVKWYSFYYVLTVSGKTGLSSM